MSPFKSINLDPRQTMANPLLTGKQRVKWSRIKERGNKTSSSPGWRGAVKQPELLRGIRKSPELIVDAGKLPGEGRKKNYPAYKVRSVNEALLRSSYRLLASKFAHISAKLQRWTKRMWSPNSGRKKLVKISGLGFFFGVQLCKSLYFQFEVLYR